jgi:predicted AAA+ superfamily ATPase
VRKLKRLDVNLLAGRAIERNMFPLSSYELADDFDLESVLANGSIPTVIDNPSHKIDILSSYVGTYLRQEIQQEALVEDIGSFSRFLKVAAIMNAETINISNVARDSAVARTTAERYFDILVDTLIGFRLPGWQPKLKSKERSTPKFYFFDTGVVRTCTDRIRDPLSDLEIGKLLETFLLHELRSAIGYLETGGSLYYWQSGGGAEIDFIWERGDTVIAIEVKSATSWRKDYTRHLKSIQNSYNKKITTYLVYRGVHVLKDDGVKVLPVKEFLRRLHSGEILG